MSPRDADRVILEKPHLRPEVSTPGDASGIRAGTFLDKATGARDLGFGLSVVDFLLEPAEPEEPISDGQYEFGDHVHGAIPKRYVEGPQICTQAERLEPTVIRGERFEAVKLRSTWHKACLPRQVEGSTWGQNLLVPDDARDLLSSDRVTTASESPALFLRVDMPGHIRLRDGSGFEHVYLGYHDPAIHPAAEFAEDFSLTIGSSTIGGNPPCPTASSAPIRSTSAPAPRARGSPG